MIVKGITVRIPPVLVGIIFLLAAMGAFCFGSTHNPVYIFVGVPLLAALLVLPLVLAYTGEKQILRNIDAARSVAKNVRARQITASMRGETVVMEGTVLRVSGLLLNRPVYLLEDGTGRIAAKRFALPAVLVGPGAEVEVLGRVFGRQNGRMYINAMTVTPVQRKKTVEDTAVEEKEIHIKHYN